MRAATFATFGRAEGFDALLQFKEKNPPTANLMSLSDIANCLVVQVGINLEDYTLAQRLLDKMKLFIETGDLQRKTFKVSIQHCCH